MIFLKLTFVMYQSWSLFLKKSHGGKATSYKIYMLLAQDPKPDSFQNRTADMACHKPPLTHLPYYVSQVWWDFPSIGKVTDQYSRDEAE